MLPCARLPGHPQPFLPAPPPAVFTRSVVLNITRKNREWRFYEFIGLRLEDLPKASAVISDIRKILRQVRAQLGGRQAWAAGVPALALVVVAAGGAALPWARTACLLARPDDAVPAGACACAACCARRPAPAQPVLGSCTCLPSGRSQPCLPPPPAPAQDPRVIQKLHRRVFLDKLTRDEATIYLSFYVEAANRDAFMAGERGGGRLRCRGGGSAARCRARGHK